MSKPILDEQDDAAEGATPAARGARIAKGRLGEQKLNDWFKAQQLSYVAICQDLASFAPLFRDSVKRPDFLMLIDGIGLIAIDAKNKTLSAHNEFTLTVSTELARAIAFERLFRMPLWYAFRNCEREDSPWYWINSLKVIEVGVKRLNGQEVEFLAIKLDEFECIASAADLAKLYTHRPASYRHLAG
ncbi:MAG: hypothetical protein ABIT83_11625 [Massilia sp.]